MTTTKKTTKKMQETIDMMSQGHVVWQIITHKNVQGCVHYDCNNESVVYTNKDFMLSGHTSTKSIHPSIIKGLLERGLIAKKNHECTYIDHRGISHDQIHGYYVLTDI